jgi:death-on-curing protein
VIYLTLPELVHIAERATGGQGVIRDAGLLEAAASRPGARAFGADAYQDLETKAAALLHSLARNRALVDGNKRLALAALVAFYGVNGRHLPLSDDEAYDLVMQVAVGQLDSVSDIAAILAAATRPRR